MLRVSYRGRFSASERERRDAGYSANYTSELVSVSLTSLVSRFC